MGEAKRRRLLNLAPRDRVPLRELPPIRLPRPVWERLDEERDRRIAALRRPVGVEEVVADLIEVALEGGARARRDAERTRRRVVLPGEEGA